MENTKIYLNSFPLDYALKIDDLIYYDMPILSRYIFQGKNYLYYHVDDENNLDTYLVFKVEEYELYKLISGNLSLKETIINVNDFVYIIDRDNSDKIVKTAYLHSTKISDEYLPDEDSIIKINFVDNCFYSSLIQKYQPKYYTERLRKKAFYLKISSKNEKYGDTISFDDMSSKIFPKITSAYKNYTKIDFFNKFKKTFTDKLNLEKIYNKISDEIEFRIVDLNYGSFEIGIATETLLPSSAENSSIKEWTKNIRENFKEDVLEIDLENKEDFEKITQKFDEEQRNKIFKPIIDLVNDKNITFSYKNNQESKFKQLNKPKENTIKRLIPQKAEEEIKKLELELVQFTGVIEKGKKISINPSNSLFSPLEETQLILSTQHFNKYGYKLKLRKDIPVLISKKDTGIIELLATYDEQNFSAKMESANLESAVEKLVKRIYEYYLNKDSD